MTRKTRRLGVGSLLRLAAVFALCHFLQGAGLLNQFTAPGLIVAGFLVESLTLIWIGRKSGRPDPSRCM